MDNKLDGFAKKLLSNLPDEVPSFDFTAQVMSRVEILDQASSITYKPLISKKIWILITLFVVGIFSYLIFGDVTMDGLLASSLQVESLPKINFHKLPMFRISNIVLYGIIGFTFFSCIQVFVLKHHFNSRYA